MDSRALFWRLTIELIPWSAGKCRQWPIPADLEIRHRLFKISHAMTGTLRSSAQALPPAVRLRPPGGTLQGFWLAVLAFPPEVLMLRDAFLFQQGLDGDALLAALRLDLFNLFSCKHISVCVSAAKLDVTYTN